MRAQLRISDTPCDELLSAEQDRLTNPEISDSFTLPDTWAPRMPVIDDTNEMIINPAKTQTKKHLKKTCQSRANH